MRYGGGSETELFSGGPGRDDCRLSNREEMMGFGGVGVGGMAAFQ